MYYKIVTHYFHIGPRSVYDYYGRDTLVKWINADTQVMDGNNPHCIDSLITDMLVLEHFDFVNANVDTVEYRNEFSNTIDALYPYNNYCRYTPEMSARMLLLSTFVNAHRVGSPPRQQRYKSRIVTETSSARAKLGVLRYMQDEDPLFVEMTCRDSLDRFSAMEKYLDQVETFDFIGAIQSATAIMKGQIPC